MKTPEETNKPDFRQLANEHFDPIGRADDGNEQRSYVAGMERIWNDYVVERDNRIKELETLYEMVMNGMTKEKIDYLEGKVKDREKEVEFWRSAFRDAAVRMH